MKPIADAALAAASVRRPGGLLNPQVWNEIALNYRSNATCAHLVIDNFLADDACADLRSRLVRHKGWSFMNVEGRDRLLHVRNPAPAIAKTIAAELGEHLPNILAGTCLVEHRAFMTARTDALAIHADNAAVTLNLYLTPEEFNLEPRSGGLVLLQLRRTTDMALHEFNAPKWATQHCVKHGAGDIVEIPYRYNRAILFDAHHFHAANVSRFEGGSAWKNRINLAFRFDREATFLKRSENYAH